MPQGRQNENVSSIRSDKHRTTLSKFYSGFSRRPPHLALTQQSIDIRLKINKNENFPTPPIGMS